MPRICSQITITAVLLAVTGFGGGSTRSAETPVAVKKPDWAGLDALLTTGDYGQAAEVADGIAATVKPKRRDPDYLPRSVEFIRALTRLGVARLRLGDLDAADEAFSEAYRTYKDREFQRLLSLEARHAAASVTTQILLLEANAIELLDLRSMVILHRLQALNLVGTGAAASTAMVGQPTEDVARWLGELKVLKRIAAEARESFAEQMVRGGPAVLSSPYTRALAGKFRPEMIAGITSRELWGMPIETLESDAVRESLSPSGKLPEILPGAEVREALLKASLEHFQAAAAALEEAVIAVSPSGSAGLKADARIEAALLEAELLANRGAILRLAVDFDRAREDVRKAMELQREVSVLRRIQTPDAHPDLFWPLLLDADVGLENVLRLLADGDTEQAQSVLGEVSKTLVRASSLSVPEKHPLRGYLADLTSRLDRQRAAVDETLPRSDAADTAARRLRRAIDATALPGIAR